MKYYPVESLAFPNHWTCHCCGKNLPHVPVGCFAGTLQVNDTYTYIFHFCSEACKNDFRDHPLTDSMINDMIHEKTDVVFSFVCTRCDYTTHFAIGVRPEINDISVCGRCGTIYLFIEPTTVQQCELALAEKLLGAGSDEFEQVKRDHLERSGEFVKLN